MKTRAEKNQSMDALRSARREQGLCIGCGERPPGRNLNNSPSSRCYECKMVDKMSKQRSRHAAGRGREADEGHDFQDTKPFKAYVKAIGKLLDKYTVITTGLIHSKLGRDRQVWTLSAIKWLDGIEECGAGPVRYRRFQEPRRLELPQGPLGQYHQTRQEGQDVGA